jgi:hypothetical protein
MWWAAANLIFFMVDDVFSRFFWTVVAHHHYLFDAAGRRGSGLCLVLFIPSNYGKISSEVIATLSAPGTLPLVVWEGGKRASFASKEIA